MELLWQLEEKRNKKPFKSALIKAKASAMFDNLTIKELLALGFNNNWLILPNGKRFNIGYIRYNGEYSNNLNDKQLNTHIYMREDFGTFFDDTDADGYHIAKVYLRNEEDEGLFRVCDDD